MYVCGTVCVFSVQHEVLSLLIYSTSSLHYRKVLGTAKLSDIVQKLLTGKYSNGDTVAPCRQYKKVAWFKYMYMHTGKQDFHNYTYALDCFIVHFNTVIDCYIRVYHLKCLIIYLHYNAVWFQTLHYAYCSIFYQHIFISGSANISSCILLHVHLLYRKSSCFLICACHVSGWPICYIAETVWHYRKIRICCGYEHWYVF